MKTIRNLFFLLILTAPGAILFAQDKPKDENAAPASGFRAEYLKQLTDVEKKVVDLAQAMPQEKYTWRPAEGVRSVSEVFVHIGGSNFLLPVALGLKAPEGFSSDMEKTITEKRKVVEVLKQSFQHLREAVLNTSDADLDKPAKFFGTETTVRDVFFQIANHIHEHLGQSIAYARMNGVVPPWTAEQQAKEKEKSKSN